MSSERARRAFAIGAALAFVSLAACSSTPDSFPVRPVLAGDRSGLSVPLQRPFRDAEEYERFAAGLRSRGDLPAHLAGVDWDQEMVVAVFGGECEPGVHVRIESAGLLGSALVVVAKRDGLRPDRVFDDEPAPPEPRRAGEPTTPFALAALPRYSGTVRFMPLRGAADGAR